MTCKDKQSPGRLSFATAVLLSIALLWAFSCKRSGEHEAGEGSSVTLRVIGEGYPPVLALEKVKGEYEAATGVKIEITKRDHMAVVSEMDREFSSGRVTYDLVIMPHRLLGKFVEKGYVRSVAEYLKSPSFDRGAFDPEMDLLPGWWREVSWYRGEPYGFPFMALSMYLWYRQDLFADEVNKAAFLKAYGHPLEVPTTWEEYREVAEFFTRPDDGLYGTGIQGQRHVALWYEWLSYLYGFGGRILGSPTGDQYGDIVVNSPQAVRATEFYLSMLAFSSPEALNHNWDDALSNFQQGRTAMAIMWHDSAPWIEDKKESLVSGKVGYAAPPSVSGDPVVQLEGHTMLIPTHAEHPEAAFRFMSWVLSQDAQVKQALAGGMPPRASAYKDPRVQAIPYMKAFRVLADSAIPKPTIPEADQMTEIMTLELSRILSREVSVKEGLDKMAAELEKLLQGKAKLAFPISE